MTAVVDVATMARRPPGVRELPRPGLMSVSRTADSSPVFPCRCGLPRSVSGVSRCGGWRFPARVSMRFRGIGYDPVREGAMRLAEAKDMVRRLIMAGQPDAAWSLLISPASSDGDPGKFLIDGKVARAIHRFSGWHVPINLGWFQGRLRPAGH